MRISTLLAAAALVLPVSPVRADPPTYQCGLAAAQVRGSGRAHDGVLWGYALQPGDTVGIRCTLLLNGSPVGSATGTGSGIAVAADTVYFNPDPTDTVGVCAAVTTASGTFRDCHVVTHGELPPPAVVEQLCTVTKTIGGMGFNVLGLVVIDEDGHVYAARVLLWYCRESATYYVG